MPVFIDAMKYTFIVRLSFFREPWALLWVCPRDDKLTPIPGDPMNE